MWVLTGTWWDLPPFSSSKQQQLLPIFLLKEAYWWGWVKAKKPSQFTMNHSARCWGKGPWQLRGSGNTMDLSQNQSLSARTSGMSLDVSLSFLSHEVGLTAPTPQVCCKVKSTVNTCSCHHCY